MSRKSATMAKYPWGDDKVPTVLLLPCMLVGAVAVAYVMVHTAPTPGAWKASSVGSASVLVSRQFGFSICVLFCVSPSAVRVSFDVHVFFFYVTL
jgi:hypothetical protein